jgi:hypothetical protein
MGLVSSVLVILGGFPASGLRMTGKHVAVSQVEITHFAKANSIRFDNPALMIDL